MMLPYGGVFHGSVTAGFRYFFFAQEADAIDESFVDGILSDRFNGLDMASVSATVSQINLRLLSVQSRQL